MRTFDHPDIIVQMYKNHPELSPKQLVGWLREKYSPKHTFPSVATATKVLEERGMVPPRGDPVPHGWKPPFRGAEKPNAIWCARLGDAVKTPDGYTLRPFVLVDAYTRYLLRLEVIVELWSMEVDNVFRSAFRNCGLPETVRARPEPPFFSDEPGAATALVYWLTRAGIRVDRRPRAPFVTVDVDVPPQPDGWAYVHALDELRKRHNEQPGPSSYVPSPVPYPKGLLRREPFPWEKEVNVDEAGRIKVRGRKVYVGAAAAYQEVTLIPIDDRFLEVRLGTIPLGLLERENPARGLIPAPIRHVLSMRNEDPFEEVDWASVLTASGPAERSASRRPSSRARTRRASSPSSP